MYRRTGGSSEAWHFKKILHLKVGIVGCFFCLLHIDYIIYIYIYIYIFDEIRKKELIEMRREERESKFIGGLLQL